jgi:Zn-dependent protease with chaperone function
MSEELLRSLTNVLLELPFSRRAETEADLIGLKLMALAGYNAAKGPEAFKLLASEGAGLPIAAQGSFADKEQVVVLLAKCMFCLPHGHV